MRKLFILLFCSLSLTCWSQEDEKVQIGKTIEDFLKFLSFSDTTALNIDSLSTVFTSDGRLTANFGKKPISFTVTQFVENIRNAIRGGQTSSIEKELARKIDVFGKIAHVFSTYELTMTGKDGKIVRRGINSIQLLKQEERWLIYSIVWDRENDVLKIPAQYLKN
jgi:ketosteroid isomerase-like protein